MADIIGTAKILYGLAIENSDLVDTLEAQRTSLATSIATDPGFGVAITSGTLNQGSYAGTVVMTNLERLRMIDVVLKHVEAGVPPASRTYARF